MEKVGICLQKENTLQNEKKICSKLHFLCIEIEDKTENVNLAMRRYI